MRKKPHVKRHKILQTIQFMKQFISIWLKQTVKKKIKKLEHWLSLHDFKKNFSCCHGIILLFFLQRRAYPLEM